MFPVHRRRRPAMLTTHLLLAVGLTTAAADPGSTLPNGHAWGCLPGASTRARLFRSLFFFFGFFVLALAPASFGHVWTHFWVCVTNLL
jgi:hypothetical protein